MNIFKCLLKKKNNAVEKEQSTFKKEQTSVGFFYSELKKCFKIKKKPHN